MYSLIGADTAASKMVQDYIRTRLQAGYDSGYLQQLFDFIVYIISSLEAPARSESTKKVSQLACILAYPLCLGLNPRHIFFCIAGLGQCQVIRLRPPCRSDSLLV